MLIRGNLGAAAWGGSLTSFQEYKYQIFPTQMLNMHNIYIYICICLCLIVWSCTGEYQNFILGCGAVFTISMKGLKTFLLRKGAP